jgi:hypothetical protein
VSGGEIYNDFTSSLPSSVYWAGGAAYVASGGPERPTWVPIGQLIKFCCQVSKSILLWARMFCSIEVALRACKQYRMSLAGDHGRIVRLDKDAFALRVCDSRRSRVHDERSVCFTCCFNC